MDISRPSTDVYLNWGGVDLIFRVESLRTLEDVKSELE